MKGARLPRIAVSSVWEVAEPFGVPGEMILLQAPMRMG